MRVLAVFLLTIIVIGQSFSQELTESDLARLQEKFILQTDQNYYLVGDEISIQFQVEIENQPSFISSTAYFELMDKSGEVRKKVMAPIIEGSGSIRFYLPSTLKSGDFTLIGYTRWMRNYGSKNIPQLGLKILNTFENLDADTFVSDSTLSIKNPKSGNYLKSIPNSSFKIGLIFPFKGIQHLNHILLDELNHRRERVIFLCCIEIKGPAKDVRGIKKYKVYL